MTTDARVLIRSARSNPQGGKNEKYFCDCVGDDVRRRTGYKCPRATTRRRQLGELGCKQVSFIGKDRDSIRVGKREGRFKAIRLEARNNDVEILDLKVVYANGAPDDIPVRSNIRAGSKTRPLDLKGRERAIQQIEMVYRSRPSFRESGNSMRGGSRLDIRCVA